MRAWKLKCTGVADISQVRNPSIPNPKKITRDKSLTPKNWDKLSRPNQLFPNRKEKTAYLIDAVWDGRLW
jgi:hypothetical protein